MNGGVVLPRVVAAAETLGLPLADAQVAQLVRYRSMLLEWNQRINLTAITDPDEVETLHFVDALSVALGLTGLRDRPMRVIDVGTGAGLPGLALKIALPAVDLTLIESVGKKARFVEAVIAELGLTGARVVVGRAEELGRAAAHREAYDVALARALAALPVLAEYCLPFVRVGGRLLAHKKLGIDDELSQARRAIGLLGGQIVGAAIPDLPGLPEDRQILIIEKVSPTPDVYPRRPGVPVKDPL